MSWATSSRSSPEWEVEGKARTHVSTGPLHTPGPFSFRDPAGVRTYPEAPDLYVYRCAGVLLWGSGLTEVWRLSLPRGALWPAHPVGSGAVLRMARRRHMGAVSSC